MLADGYVRDRAMAEAVRVVEALSGYVSHVGLIVDAGDFGEESRAFLEALDPADECLEKVLDWLSVVREREAIEREVDTAWVDFLAGHPELYGEEGDGDSDTSE
jgi:hypothetical protein